MPEQTQHKSGLDTVNISDFGRIWDIHTQVLGIPELSLALSHLVPVSDPLPLADQEKETLK